MSSLLSLDTTTGAAAAPTQHAKQPIVTGTSVLGVKYAGGVLLAADTLCSYGSMAKYKSAERLRVVSGGTIIGAGGEYSDFQFIVDDLKKKAQQEACEDDGGVLDAKGYWNYLRAVMYNRRNQMDPLWNDLIVAGPDFLGFVDKIGTTFQDNFIATGFGSHLSLPILRDKWRADLTEGEARTILEDCLRVLFYRDCRALNRIQIAKVTNEGSVVSEP